MTATVEPTTRRPVRKFKPPPTKSERTGHEWSSSAVPRLYLDDVEAIFDVMQDYAEHSSSDNVYRRAYEVRREAYEVRKEAIEVLNRVRGINAEPDEAVLEPLPEPEPPVEIETDKYKEIYSIAELRSLNELKARELRMSVRGLDLWLRFTPNYCSLITMSDDADSTEAFHKIKAILEERTVKTLSYVFSIRFVLAYLTVLIGVAVVYQYSRNAITAWLYTIMIVGSFISWPFLFGLWSKRPEVVTLKYRRDSPGFWEAHTADIVKWTIIGALGAFLAGIMLLLANQAINQLLPGSAP